MDKASGRDSTNSGSDSAIHHTKGTASEQHSSTPKASPSVPTTGPNGSVVRDLVPTPVAGSAVK